MLVWRGRVVYVGQSVNVLSRVSTHRNNYERALKGKLPHHSKSLAEQRVIKFEKAFVKFCEVRELDRLELELIAKHKPEFNVQLRERRAVVIDLGALGFDGDRYREPIFPKPYTPFVAVTKRKPKFATKPKVEMAFVSPFNKFNKFPRPKFAA